jgi:hypothetical protein
MPDVTDIVEQLSYFARASRSASALRVSLRAMLKPKSRDSSGRCRDSLLSSRRTCEEAATLAGMFERHAFERRARTSNRREPAAGPTGKEELRTLTAQIESPHLRYP